MRHRTLVAALAAVVTLCASAQSYRFSFPAGKRFVLPAANANGLFWQCSRRAPERAGDYWEPSDAELDAMEERLVVYLESRAAKDFPPIGIPYHRQYIGFVRDGQRFIYGNFYPGGDEVRESERKTPLVICDGGPSLWGVAYDVAGGTFSDLDFNGLT
jgi:hypothetical protein